MDNPYLDQKYRGRSLSDYWRVDRSLDRIAELSSVLEGARAATSLLKGRFIVNWSSDLHSQQPHSISLDPSVLTGFGAPLPGKAVDVVIGLALHEVGHERWTRPFPQGRRLNALSGAQCQLLHRIHNILEDAYVDARMPREGKVLGEYIASMRRALVSDRVLTRTMSLLMEKPNRVNTLEVWSGIALYGIPLETRDADLDMLSLAIWLLDETATYVELESHRARADRAWKVFRKIDSLPAPPASPSVRTVNASSSGDVNPWLDDGTAATDDESDEDSGEATGIEKDSAPASTNFGEDREEDWCNDDPDVREDEDEAGDDPGHEERAGGKSEGAELDEEEGEYSTGGASADEDSPSDEGDDDAYGSGGAGETEPDSDAVSEQLLTNLTGGDEDSLTELSDHLDSRQPGKLSYDEAVAVDDAETSERKDMGSLLRREAGLRRQVFISQKAEYDYASHLTVRERTRKEAQQMRAALRKIDEVGARWRYGTNEGKLDTRRLAKATTGKESLYRRRDSRGRPATALLLLLDVSGSMDGRLGDVADAAAIFSEALRGMGIWYEIDTYTCGAALCDVSHGCDYYRPDAGLSAPGYTIIGSSNQALSLRRVGAGGGTPSGAAIATACYRIRNRPEKRRLVIHFTDGLPDSDYDVAMALDYARRLGVDVLTISVCSDQSHLYGDGRCRVIRDVSEMAGATQELLAEIY